MSRTNWSIATPEGDCTLNQWKKTKLNSILNDFKSLNMHKSIKKQNINPAQNALRNKHLALRIHHGSLAIFHRRTSRLTGPFAGGLGRLWRSEKDGTPLTLANSWIHRFCLTLMNVIRSFSIFFLVLILVAVTGSMWAEVLADEGCGSHLEPEKFNITKTFKKLWYFWRYCFVSCNSILRTNHWIHTTRVACAAILRIWEADLGTVASWSLQQRIIFVKVELWYAVIWQSQWS